MPTSPAPVRHGLPAPAGRLAASLALWFERERRDLPWREQRTPYRVWLSEVMLQQTQVAVVLPYFQRFIARFPDVAALAAASEDSVLSLWSGLGYYSRGRNLHRAARQVVEQHGGVFPSTAAALRALPGVGPYTANAIASLAFAERVAVVDGNVARVVARLCNDATPIDGADGKRLVQARAQALMDVAAEPGPHNEAMMELGALVCTPRAADCPRCPWRSGCLARASDTVAMLPRKEKKQARRTQHVACLVVTSRDAVWLEKNPARGLFGGLYQPPALEIDAPARAPAAWRALAKARGVRLPKHLPRAQLVERTLTHRDLRFLCLHVATAGRKHAALKRRDQLGTIGLSSAARAVIDAVMGAGG